MAQAAESSMTGRPSGYSQELADEICEWLANGNSLRTYCLQDDKPSYSAIFRWLEAQPAFRDNYMRARETQAHNDADYMNQIAADVASGIIKPDQGRVMMDCLKWTAGKRAPKYYGEKVQLSGDADGAPLVVTWAQTDKA